MLGQAAILAIFLAVFGPDTPLRTWLSRWYPCKLSLDFDLTRDRYVSADYTSGAGVKA